LGVSLTGIMDNPIMFSTEGLAELLVDLRKQALQTNKSMAKQLGIPASTAITCIKPSGTVSQLVDSASGIHARHSPYYVRTVRADNKDPVTQFMIDNGVPAEPDITQPESTTVFSFPFASPANAVSRNDRTAIEQLELWLLYQRHWCEHKPSITVSVREHEWLEVGSWVYEHFNEVSGISFLPFSEHSYKQAPYQDCDKKDYLDLQKQMPSNLDWTRLVEYEKEDTTTGAQDLACSAGVCEVVDIQAA